MWVPLHVAIYDVTTVAALDLNLSFLMSIRAHMRYVRSHLDHIGIVSGLCKEEPCATCGVRRDVEY